MKTTMKNKSAAAISLTAILFAIGTLSFAQQRDSVKTETTSGLRITTYDFPAGKVRVTLPDDMAAGDTISGTVIAEPAGRNEQEKRKNAAELQGYVIELENQKSPVSGGVMQRVVLSPGLTSPRLILFDAKGNQAGFIPLPLPSSSAAITPTTFNLPTLGQTGRPIQISGPFDGNSANTSVQVGGKDAPVIAESPRQVVVESPRDVVGSSEIKVAENGATASGAFRNLKIDLTAPKTSLLRGESTELHVQVNGLEGLTQPVNIQVQNQSPSNINMSGGNTQTIPIQPTQVQTGGTFSWTTPLTGTSSGGFTITATVPSGPFLSPNPSTSPSPSPSESPLPQPKPPQDPTHQTDPGGSGLRLDDGWHGPLDPMSPRRLGDDGKPPLNPPVSPEPNRPVNPPPKLSPCACDGVVLKDTGETAKTLVDGNAWVSDDVDAYGNHVNPQGKPVDENGKSVDANGRLINDKGQLINDKGELVDSKGEKLPPGAPPIDGAKTATPMINDGNGKPKSGTTKVITGVRVPVTMKNIPFEMNCIGTTEAPCKATVVIEVSATAIIKERKEAGWPDVDTEVTIDVEKTKKASHTRHKSGGSSSTANQLDLDGRCVKDPEGKFHCQVTGTFDVGQVFVVKFPRALIVELYQQRDRTTKYYPEIEIKTKWTVKASTCRFKLDGGGWNQGDLSITRTSTVPGNDRKH